MKTSRIRERSVMRGTIKLLLVAAVAAAIGVGGFTGMAVAHSTTIGSQHTIDFTPDVASDRFTGQVSSKKAACERGRSIVLYRVVGDTSVPDQEVTTARTDSGGMWSKGVGEAQAGTYYAVAAKKVMRSPGHKHVCKVARSAPLAVSPVLEELAIDPDSVAVGQESTGTVSLSVVTEEDLMVSLESSNETVASVPATITVSAGQTQASFWFTAVEAGSATITASLNGKSFAQTLHVFTTLN